MKKKKTKTKNDAKVARFRRAQEKKVSEAYFQVLCDNRITSPASLRLAFAKAKEKEEFLRRMTNAFEEDTGGALFSEAMMRAFLRQLKRMKRYNKRLNKLVAAQAEHIVSLSRPQE